MPEYHHNLGVPVRLKCWTSISSCSSRTYRTSQHHTLMCILLVTTLHPVYPYILLSNRDEFLSRPTARATWWSPRHSHVLGGRDLQRDVRGTWLGITRQGRIAVLTNFREEGEIVLSKRSRGELPKMFLEVPPDSSEAPEQFARRLVERGGTRGWWV